MKILHVYKTSMPASYGGVETFIDTLCKQNAILGVKNTVLALHADPAKSPITMNGYAVHQAKQNFFVASTGFSLNAFGQFKKLAKQADLIHYHFPNPFADLMHLVCSPKKPSVVTYHSDIIKQKCLLHFYKPLRRCFLNSVNHIVAASPNYLDSSSVLQKYLSKSSIIPYGIDPSAYESFDPGHLYDWRYRLQEPFFLFVGTLRYYKGLHIALEAIAGTKIKLVIAGSGGIEKQLKAQAASLKLDNNVTFLGAINDKDKIALLHLCYGFVFPSHLRSEAFGISLLEAATVGKPMICCEIGTGTTFVNIANETGLVVHPESVAELREAMQYLLNNPDLVATMGRNAKQRAYELFASDKQAQAYYQLYKRFLY